MINFYYDNIIDGIPAPNGTTNIGLTKDIRQIPFNKDKTISSPINIINTFYFVMKANKIVIDLFTGKQRATNLFYPLEITDLFHRWNRDWVHLISPRAKQLIKKQRMKLLILAPSFTGSLWKALQLKKYIHGLIDSGISKDSIYVVLGDIRCTYKHLLELENVYGIDWCQIYSQIIYKVRFGQSNLDWIAPQDANFLFKANDKLIDHSSWKPNTLFNVVSTHPRDHDIALYLELIYKNMLKFGNFNFDIGNYQVTTLNDNHINPRASMLEKDQKRGIFKNLSKLPISNNTDILYYDNELLENTVVTIICDENFVDTHTSYRNEIAALSPGLKVWQSIALGHPFMILGNVDTMTYLNSEGYFSCNELINQHYDSIYNSAKRSNEIVNNLQWLADMPKEKLTELMNESIPFLKKNQQLFFERRMQSKFLELFVDMRWE